MRPYACYPGSRTRFAPMNSNLQTPGVRNVPFEPGKEARPSANIIRKDGLYEIQLAVPGFSKEQIRLEVKEDQLVVSATNESQQTQKPTFLRQEFDYTSFKRIFRLHKNANAAALKASFDQGILTISIPDREPETIQINIH
ncbi:MAG: Hsp20/alpha crystallin family protein [Saprospiraceae bacterium]